ERILYPTTYGKLFYDDSELEQWKQLAVYLNQYVFQKLQFSEKATPASTGGQKDETIDIDLQLKFYNFPTPLLAEAEPLVKDLGDICDIGLEAFDYFRNGKIPSTEWRDAKLARLAEAAKPKAAVELMIVQPIKELVIATAEQEK